MKHIKTVTTPAAATTPGPGLIMLARKYGFWPGYSDYNTFVESFGKTPA